MEVMVIKRPGWKIFRQRFGLDRKVCFQWWCLRSSLSVWISLLASSTERKTSTRQWYLLDRDVTYEELRDFKRIGHTNRSK